MNSQDFDYLSREIEGLKRQLAAGIPVPEKKRSTGNTERVVISSAYLTTGYPLFSPFLPGDPYDYQGECIGIILENYSETGAKIAINGEFEESEFVGTDFSSITEESIIYRYYLNSTVSPGNHGLNWSSNKYESLDRDSGGFNARKYASACFVRRNSKIIVNVLRDSVLRNVKHNAEKANVNPNFASLAVGHFVASASGYIYDRTSTSSNVVFLPSFVGRLAHFKEIDFDPSYLTVYIEEIPGSLIYSCGEALLFDGLRLQRNPTVNEPTPASTTTVASRPTLTAPTVYDSATMTGQYYCAFIYVSDERYRRMFDALGYTPKISSPGPTSTTAYILDSDNFTTLTPADGSVGNTINTSVCEHFGASILFFNDFNNGISSKNLIFVTGIDSTKLKNMVSPRIYQKTTTGSAGATQALCVEEMPGNQFNNSTEYAKINLSISITSVGGPSSRTYSESGPGDHSHAVYSGESRNFSMTLDSLPSSYPSADNYGNYRIWKSVSGLNVTVNISSPSMPYYFRTVTIESNYPLN